MCVQSRIDNIESHMSHPRVEGRCASFSLVATNDGRSWGGARNEGWVAEKIKGQSDFVVFWLLPLCPSVLPLSFVLIFPFSCLCLILPGCASSCPCQVRDSVLSTYCVCVEPCLIHLLDIIEKSRIYSSQRKEKKIHGADADGFFSYPRFTR